MNQAADILAEYLLPREPFRTVKNIKQRLREMVKVFNDLGFLASLSKSGGGFLIEYRSCAFSDAIPALGKMLCEAHRTAAAKAIGDDEVLLEKWHHRRGQHM